MLNAVDISNWSGLITRQQVRDWKAAGVKLVICGTQNRTITRQQLQTAIAAGLMAEVYVYLYFDSDPHAKVRRALETIRGFPVRRLWLDVEDSATGQPPAQVVQSIRELVKLVEEYENT